MYKQSLAVTFHLYLLCNAVISPIMHTVALLTAVLSCLFSLTMAQNDTFNLTAYKTCPYDGVGADLYNATGSVNSTGRVGFRFDPVAGWGLEEYSLSVTFDEKRTPNTKYGTYKPEVIHYTHSWLSVPQYSKGNACVYQLRAQNASASGTGMNGCEGVLSQKCYDSLLNSTFDFPSPKAQKQRCPAFNITEAIMEACSNMTDDSASRGPFVIPNGKFPEYRRPEFMFCLNTCLSCSCSRPNRLWEHDLHGRACACPA